ncbi:biotin--[acetyl-CoA-carboxylase] ligase [Qipengyuania spongiae]|uniref:biotin--[acetyl-CoA-carboxylase] ligase n=1 Tax=Qipengyuania spongiae TaxID=2909673 RepID=UPI0030B9B9D5
MAETGSTNADLLAALAEGQRAMEGDWLLADRQVAGRGRQGRAWSDGAGNFMGSTVVSLGDGGPTAETLSFVAGLALYEAVLPFLPTPGTLTLKWPNDLLLEGAKLAGILLERSGETIVMGFGVNLAQAPELTDRPTIALSETGPAVPRDLFAERLAASLATELERWRSFGVELILRRWQAAAHPVGTPLTVSPPGEQEMRGYFAGLEPNGALRLRLADGTIRAIHAGDVMLIDGER